MVSNNKIVVCEKHELKDIESILNWLGSDYIFYYSCENCKNCEKCNEIIKAS